MKTTATRYIEACNETRNKLMKVFGCTEKMVILALTYRKNSDLAKKIRYVAVKEYGAQPMCHCPECETLYTTELDGKQYMRQAFNNGAVLLWLKGTSEVIVRFRDHDELFQCESLPKLSEIQLYAESL